MHDGGGQNVTIPADPGISQYVILQGGREVNDFIDYIARESTNPLNGWDRKGKKVKKTEL